MPNPPVPAAAIALLLGVVLLLPTAAHAMSTADAAADNRPVARDQAERLERAKAQQAGQPQPAALATSVAAIPALPVRPGAPDAPDALDAHAPDASDADLGADGELGTLFATVAGQDLVLPSPATAVGFHEASGQALPLTPVGTPMDNHNAGHVELPPVDGANRYVVLPTRRRGTAATSAVDIRIEHGLPVTAVADGIVIEVSDYALYGRTPDALVDIQSAKNPELRIRMLHIEDVQVQRGDAVVAGETVIASSTRQLPFGSQIDRFSSEGPHLHVEVHHRPGV